MYTFKKSIGAKAFLIFILIVGFSVIYLEIIEHNNQKLILAILCVAYMSIGFSAVLQEKITIDDNRIIQTFGIHPIYKPRIMKWEDVEYVIKDGWMGMTVYRITSSRALKNKYINISGVTDMNLIINEIVKRAKNAKVDSKIQILK